MTTEKSEIWIPRTVVVLQGFAVLWFISSFFGYGSAPRTGPTEANALNTIFRRWNISSSMSRLSWNTTGDPCSSYAIFADNQNYKDKYDSFNPAVIRDCSLDNSSTCHIIRLTAFQLGIVGIIPEELKYLSKLENLYIDSIGVVGEIPATLVNLQKLEFMWASDNNFGGKVPDFLGNLTKLASLMLQGNSFQGPIPSNLANLQSLAELSTSTSHITSFFVGLCWNRIFINFNSIASCIRRLNESSSSKIAGTSDSQLFQSARLSPSSLRYYGLGLENGSYSIFLQFAEIAFTDDPVTHKSSGRRVFDIYIQVGKAGGEKWKPLSESGVLSSGTVVAVKQLSETSMQGKRQFVTEVATISAVKHRNLVTLYGCCYEGRKRILVYEYMENRSLDISLFGKSELKLDWHRSRSSIYSRRIKSKNDPQRHQGQRYPPLMLISTQKYRILVWPDPMLTI